MMENKSCIHNRLDMYYLYNIYLAYLQLSTTKNDFTHICLTYCTYFFLNVGPLFSDFFYLFTAIGLHTFLTVNWLTFFFHLFLLLLPFSGTIVVPEPLEVCLLYST